MELSGVVGHKEIDQFLKKFKASGECEDLDLTTRKRTYAIIVECLENIKNHSDTDIYGSGKLPYITVARKQDKLLIRAGNPVKNNDTGRLCERIDRINMADPATLKSIYEEIIKKDYNENSNGVGLGFILMKLKSGNNVIYNLTEIDRDNSFFEIQITVNKHIMRKLIVDKTSSSPKVILDADSNIFEISGESRPPDVSAFYGEILSWMDDYSAYVTGNKETHEPAEFSFDLEYFNSSSAKYILDFCKQLASLHYQGGKISVNWVYEKGDVDMLEAGKEMSKISRMPFGFTEKD